MLGDQDIRRFKIPMRDLLAVRGVERITDLRRVFQCLFERQGTFKRFTFDVLKHEVIRPHIVQRANIRMIERRDRAGFALEALAELFL